MSAAIKSTSTRAMRDAWGDGAPEWVVRLAEECDRASQSAVAGKLGYSGSTINQVLRNKYAGVIAGVRDKVKGAYLGASVDCPVLGDLPIDQCINHQSRPFAATNSQRVHLYRACHGGCPHSKQGDD